MKLLCWIGRDQGGYEKRDLGFLQYAQKKGLDCTIAVFEQAAHLPFKQLICTPFTTWTKLLGYAAQRCRNKLARSKQLDGYDIIYGTFPTTSKQFNVIRVAGDHREYLKRASLIRKLSIYPLHVAERSIFRSCNLFVSNSPFATTYLRWSGVDQDRIFQSTNYVDTSLFKPTKKKLPSDFTLLFVGRDDPVKNFANLKRAIQGLPVKLLVAGFEGRSDENITYLGWQSPSELAALYNSVHLTIMPSFNESFGNVVLQSLACQTPVLASEYVNAAKLLSDYVETCDTSSTSIKDAIQRCIDQYSVLAKKTKEGYAHVAKHHDSSVVLKKEYDEIVRRYKRFKSSQTT